MSYTKTNWQTGDVITAEKLNKIEDAIEEASQGGGGLTNPILTITVINEKDTSYGARDETVENGKLTVRLVEIESSATEIFHRVVDCCPGDDEDYYGVSYEEAFTEGRGQMEVSNASNCEFEDQTGWFTITDPTQDASITLTFINSVG